MLSVNNELVSMWKKKSSPVSGTSTDNPTNVREHSVENMSASQVMGSGFEPERPECRWLDSIVEFYDKKVTVKCYRVRNKCSRNSPSTSVHFASRVLRSRVVQLSRSSVFFVLAAISTMRASKSYLVSTVVL
jgi:hypothetical protein